MSRNLCIVRMSLKTVSKNNPRKSPTRHSERPGDLMKNLKTPGKTGRVGSMLVFDSAPLLCRLSLLLVLSLLCLRVFLWVLQFSSLQKETKSPYKFQFDQQIRGPV